MGHDVSDGTEQSLDLVPVNGRAGHVLEWLHVNLWRREEQRRVLSLDILFAKKSSMYMYIVGREIAG